jgi:hypothetical protein
LISETISRRNVYTFDAAPHPTMRAMTTRTTATVTGTTIVRRERHHHFASDVTDIPVAFYSQK